MRNCIKRTVVLGRLRTTAVDREEQGELGCKTWKHSKDMHDLSAVPVREAQSPECVLRRVAGMHDRHDHLSCPHRASSTRWGQSSAAGSVCRMPASHQRATWYR